MIGTSKNIWGFDPRSVPGCQLWLDAADTSSMTLSGSSVTQWRDKSGSSNHFTPTSGTPTSILDNGRNVVNFTSGAIMRSANQITFTTSSAFFIVSRLNLVNASNAGMLLDFTDMNGYKSIRFYGPNGILGGTPATFGDEYELANGAYYVNGTFNPSFGSSTYLNTYSLIGTVAPQSGGTSYLAFSSSFYERYFIGNIAEFLYYPGGVTSSQRQQIEGYLAHKWGLTTYSPVTPLSIPGCSLWLDGADPAGTGVQPSNGATVSTWVDKSGNGRNGIQYSSFARPTFLTNSLNSRGGISFNAGSSQCYQTATILPTPRAVFVVGFTSDGGFCLSGIPTVNSGHPPYYISFARDVEYGVNNTSDTLHSTNVSTSYNTNYILTGLYTGSTVSVLINGGTLSNSVAFSGTPKTPAVTLIGISSYNGSLGAALTGTINEFIAFNVDITTSQRQSIEGYLARKWGFTSMYSTLPSIHPFSSIRPHLRTFQPADIPGCQLWLDAADSSSLVLSGSNVTQWNDKSGNGYHMNTIAGSTIWSGTPEYPTIGTSINGLQTVNFKAQSGLKQSTTLDGVKNLFWVGRIEAATGSGTGPYYFLLGHDTHYDWHTPIGQKFIQSGAAQDGIANAFPASLFTSDANAVTNTAFSSINLPSPPNVSLLSVAGITGNSRYQGICYDRTTHIGWCGDLAEVLIFNTALTTSQRQQVEGYLAQKWGLTPYLPVISPLSIPGCSLWLDGADPAGTGVQPSNGAAVSTWVDKATAKNATATGTPTYLTGGGVNFNGSSYFLNQTFTMNLSQRSIFIVMQETTHTDFYGVLPFIPYPNSGNDSTTANGLSIETKNGLRFYANGGGYTSDIGNASLLVKAIYNDNMNVTTGSGYLNGTNVINANANYTASTCSGYGVGGRWLSGSMSGSYLLNGVIYEIIVFNTPLTTSQRQSIEGYLARKWGISISATLPSPHPFKSILPATAAHFYPTDITGCSLWLDAADSSQVTFSSSSNVNTWIDKSGFNNSSSNQSLGTTITYPGTKVNGLNTVNFTAGCIRGAFNGSSVINTTDVTIFIVTAETAPNDNLRMFSLTPAANYQDDQASNMLIYCAPGNYQLTFFRGGAMPSPYTVTQNVPFIYSLTQTSGTGSMWLNGGSNRTASITTSAFAVTNYNIGTQYLANQNYTGLMCEVVVYNTLLNTTQRQKVEGYLAHKWGLVNSLPSKHPYKPSPPIFPPTVQYILTATGGTIVESNYNTYHVFITSSNFVVSKAVTVNYLVVGGGGGGGDRHGGGGGAGGVLSGTWSASAGTYTVTVGAGGQFGAFSDGGQTAYGSPAGAGTKGGDSVVSGTGISITAYGGGGGGTYDGNPTGTVGSGGGGGGQNLSGIAGTAGQGNAGGAGLLPGGGGGGGAGGAGVAANTGTGGIGTSSFSTHLLAAGYGTTFAVATSPNTVISGGVAYIAGGGGGCAGTSPGPGGTGGLGGGGRGDWTDSFISAGTPNTGGGGGATRSDIGLLYSVGRNGGSGLVLLWY